MSTKTETTAAHANFYANVFKAWPVKQLGPKPTAEMLANVHGLAARPGKQALAIAMGLRDCGVTGSQIIMACGAPQLNKMRGLITDALLKRDMVPPSAEGHTVYKLHLTPKGLQRIKRTADAAAKAAEAGAADKPTKAPAKVKGTSKPPQARGKPKVTATTGDTPAPVSAPANDAAPADQPSA